MKSSLLLLFTLLLIQPFCSGEEKADSKIRAEVFKQSQTYGALAVTSVLFCEQIRFKALEKRDTEDDKKLLETVSRALRARGDSLITSATDYPPDFEPKESIESIKEQVSTLVNAVDSLLHFCKTGNTASLKAYEECSNKVLKVAKLK